jgi:hypothetical protein
VLGQHGDVHANKTSGQMLGCSPDDLNDHGLEMLFFIGKSTISIDISRAIHGVFRPITIVKWITITLMALSEPGCYRYTLWRRAADRHGWRCSKDITESSICVAALIREKDGIAKRKLSLPGEQVLTK